MARYDYRCPACLNVMEVVHAMRQRPAVRCPCGGRMRRTVSDFVTLKDKRYEFVTQHIHPGTEIRSRGGWNRFLKTHRLTDDVSPKEQLDRLEHGYADTKRRERAAAFREQTTRLVRQQLQRR